MSQMIDDFYALYLDTCQRAEEMLSLTKNEFEEIISSGMTDMGKRNVGDMTTNSLGENVYIVLNKIEVGGTPRIKSVILTHTELEDSKLGITTKPILEKVISGGQTGVDQAGLVASRENDIPTSGWVPKGYKTLNGCEEVELKRFNVVEHESSNYAGRTYANVRDADATIRLAFNFNSAGEKCTQKAILQYCKPSMDIDLNDVDADGHVVRIRQWIITNDIKILNVAGNSHLTNPEAFSTAFVILHRLFSKRRAV